MDIANVLFFLTCTVSLCHATDISFAFPNITHSSPIHFDKTKFGHEICFEGRVFKRPDGELKCCYKKGGRVACQTVECEDEDTTVIEDVKTEMDRQSREPGAVCVNGGMVFRGKNNLLYCCVGLETQRLCTRIPCPISQSMYDEISYENQEHSEQRMSRQIRGEHHRVEVDSKFLNPVAEAPPSKHDEFFGYLQ